MDKALELANELDNMLKAIGLTDNRVPTMLRQQQAEIEALKAEKIRAYDNGYEDCLLYTSPSPRD